MPREVATNHSWTRRPVRLTVNKQANEVEAEDDCELLFVLREELGLRSPKLGCGLEQCGSCVVLLDGRPVHSCTRRVGDCVEAEIETLEGLSADGGLHPLQEAFAELNAGQCGFCLSGILMRALALLREDPAPGRVAIKAALDGHLCRCGAHPRIVRAVELAAERMAR